MLLLNDSQCASSKLAAGKTENTYRFGQSHVPQLVIDLLRSCHHPPLRNVKCHFHDGVLTLCGIVPNYFLKQLAQTVAVKIEGVVQLNNRIVVTYSESVAEDLQKVTGSMP